MSQHYDVFLSHNSLDKPAVIALAKKLKAEGLHVWLDVWNLRPGHPWQEALEQIIATTQTAAVLVGADGIGPWEDVEMRACLSEFVRRKLPVIPVLLPGCPDKPELPLFLRAFTWVDLRNGQDEDFHKLMWGITGVKPQALDDDSTPVVVTPPKRPTPQPKPTIQNIHGWPAAQVQALQRDAAQALGRDILFRDPLSSGGYAPDMLVIPAGVFLMGSPAHEPERMDSEGPQRFVTIAQPFALGRYAVTFEDYDRYCISTQRPPVSDQGWGRGRRPVSDVSWQDAQDYCAWLSAQTGQSYRLPSEAEWEYACRAGTDTPFHFGHAITPQQANYDGNYVYNGGAKGEYRHKTVAVEEFQPNAFGLHQMHGNVWEWVQDGWHDTYQGAPVDGRAWDGADDGRVLRGGSLGDVPQLLRSACRSWDNSGNRYYIIGFRLARTLIS